MIIKEILNEAIELLKAHNIEEPILKSKIILAYCMEKSKEYLLVYENEEISKEVEKDYKEKIEKLCNNIPLQYITNAQEFMGLNFYVDENVLIPRSDTEVLVETIINNIEKNRKIKVLDMCTGSGIIALTLTKLCENIEAVAVDKSEGALNVAIKNAKQLGVEGRIQYIKSDMFKDIQHLLTNCDENVDNESTKFDIIVSNPPYIETDVIAELSKDVQNEPKMALDGGLDGLDFYREICKNLRDFLKEDGNLFLEIGYNQGESVTRIFKEEFEKVECIKDFSGNDRVIFGKGYKIN